MKTKIAMIFMMINILSFSQTNYTWVKVFDEQFIDNSNNWYITNSTERKSEIIGGKLIDEFNPDENLVTTNEIFVNFDIVNDYRINFSISNINKRGKTYGFTWGFKDWDNYNCIIFSKVLGEIEYKIFSVFQGNEIVHKDWSSCYNYFDFENSFNQISIRKSVYELTFYCNNKYLDRCPVMDWPKMTCGIILGKNSKVILDYLTIEEHRESKRISEEQKQTETISPSSGSGIILTKNGYIATNHHVIKDAKHIEVDVYMGGVKKTYLADVVRNDVTNDLSLIKIRNKNFVSADLKYGIKTHDVKVGEKVFSLGYPMIDLQGDEIKLTDGLISSKTGYQNDPTTYQISAPIQPGNSGGPLFDMNGNLIGITSSGLNTAIGAQNVNYAIKASYLLNFLDIESNITSLPTQSLLIGQPLTEMVSKLSPVVVLIRVNDKTISKDELESQNEVKPITKIVVQPSNESKTQNRDVILEDLGYISKNFKKFKYNAKTKNYIKLEDQPILSYLYITNTRIYLKKGNNKSLLFEFDKWMMKENGDNYCNEMANHIVLDKERSKLIFYSSNYEYKYEYTISNQDNQLVLDNVND